MKLPPKQNSIFIELWKRLPTEHQVKVFSFRFVGSAADQYVVCGPVSTDPSLTVCASLGSVSTHLFVLVSDIEAKESADIIARVEDYDARVTHLRVGETIVLEAPSFEGSGAAALLIIKPRLLKLFENVPDHIAIGKTSVHCLLCLPLTSKEYRLKKESGIGAVLDSFVSSGREVTRKGTLREKPN